MLEVIDLIKDRYPQQSKLRTGKHSQLRQHSAEPEDPAHDISGLQGD